MENMLCLVLVVLCLCFEDISATKSYNMRDYCGKVLSLTSESTKSAIIYYEHKSRFRDKFFKMSCTAQISGWREHDIAFQLPSFDMQNWQTTLEIRQGESWDTGEQIAGLYGSFSYFDYYKTVFTTHWWKIFIRIKGKAPDNKARLFTMALNVFHRGQCYAGEYRCTNGRCIDESLTCNGYNPCGDRSDCKTGLDTQMLAIIVCTGLAAFLLITFVACKAVTFCCKKSRKQENGTSTEHDRLDNANTTMSDTDNRGHTVTYTRGGTNGVNDTGNTGTHVTSLFSDPSIQINDVPYTDSEHSVTGDMIYPDDPPPYHSVISDDLSDNASDSSATETTDTSGVRRPRRPARRHTSRYLPRYSQVIRHKESYEVRGESESTT